nr:MAG TPA: hypothetical protein [Caudoviricetes sp.]
MEKVANSFGYEIYKLSKKECNRENLEYPTLIAVINYFDEPAGKITADMSLNDAQTIEEQKEWCKANRIY